MTRSSAKSTPATSPKTPASGTASPSEHLIKLLLIGDSGVGKSCLLLRFCDDSFTPSFISTIGIDFKIRSLQLPPPDSTRCRLQIWDTAGQERFRTITTAYYRGAMGILVVYDVTDERSFNNVRNWIRNVEQFATEGVQRILVGNKCDIADKRVVSRERGEALAAELGIRFIETSAKANVSVDEAFTILTRAIRRHIDTAKQAEQQAAKGRISLLESGTEALRKSCCWGGGSGSVEVPRSPSGSVPGSPRMPSSPIKKTAAFAAKPDSSQQTIE